MRPCEGVSRFSDGRAERKRMRILVADDHALFRAGISQLLAGLKEPLEVVEADNLDSTLAALDGRQFDLILLDLLMPGMEGAAGISAVHARARGVPVVVVSMLDNAEVVRKAMAAGASGFVPKSSSPQVMLRAMELILSGGMYLPPSAIAAAPPDEMATEEAKKAPCRQRDRFLTPRQRSVLQELVAGKSNKEIARALGVSISTVKAHVAAIMRVLGATNRTQAAIKAQDLDLLDRRSGT